MIPSSRFEQFDWDQEKQGMILSAFSYSHVTLQLPAGILTEKFGSRLIIITSLIGSSVVSLLIPFLARHWMILLQVLLGAFQSGFHPAAYTCYRSWVPLNERTFATGLIIFGSFAGSVLIFFKVA